ncbi:hypothetical protein L6164_028495 [Bauhinia variegata]|uniref:Uncharacterized protein n=1 Tax=Bauhinia variegata TaxID=167791 RepID=A0ACB9L6D3_BAUVA|nr:hypothetical protein L6164_028495 [Bauhinia variegata]
MQFSSAFVLALLYFSLIIHTVVSVDYETALTKSFLFYEGQRSGKLPPNQRVQWRGDSGLQDGQTASIDLVGGYYDAGDNLKLGFPFAFTITMLSWSVVDFRANLSAKNELLNALEAIKWGTDYLIKAHPQPDVLYGEVGDAGSDHACWQRPEDMTTPRTAYRIDDQHPGSDLAAETAAALAAASIAFQPTDRRYASQLLSHAISLFEFACKHQGKYSDSITVANEVYSSSGYEDEMLWAAAWLQLVTKDKKYLNYLGGASNTGGVRTSFSWDDKFVGAQILAAKLIGEGTVKSSEVWATYKDQAEQFLCNCAQKGSNNVKKTPGGLLWFLPWNNVQYVATASFAAVVYSQILHTNHAFLECSESKVSASDLKALAQSQVDYILGSNPEGMSYMVGFGSNYPQKIHHRGASIVSIKKDPSLVTCKGGFDSWFNKDAPNPNVLVGAIVNPDENDNFQDSRGDYQHSEPTIVTNAPLVGVLAYLA